MDSSRSILLYFALAQYILMQSFITDDFIGLQELRQNDSIQVNEILSEIQFLG
jgi:hypothetical protein